VKIHVLGCAAAGVLTAVLMLTGGCATTTAGKSISDKAAADGGAQKGAETVVKKDFSAYKTAEQLLEHLTLEEKVAQLFVIRPEQLDFSLTPAQSQEMYKDGLKKVPERFAQAAADYPVGGFILFGKNIESPEQLRALTSDLARISAVPPVMAVDEEGGRVARLARSERFFLPQFKNMAAVGRTGDPENARGAGQIIGGYLLSYGFTVDFAPVADVNTNPENIVIGNRAFGSDPEVAAGMVRAFLSGLHSTGMKGCIKHFPGHGDTKGDTHADYVAVDKSWDELKRCELIPFVKNLDVTDCVMVAHVTLTKAAHDGYPASLSRELITGRLRGELGYDGVVLTDALAMGAIEKNYGSGEAAVLAFEAGNDILLMPMDFVAAYNAVLEAVRRGRISMRRLDQSVMRILRLKDF